MVKFINEISATNHVRSHLSDLISLLEPDDIKKIDDCVDAAGRRHPAWTAIHANDSKKDYVPSPKDRLVNEAVALISVRDGGLAWLKSAKKRIAQISDFEECASALAETLCYGAMLEAGFGMYPIPTERTPTPDFHYDLGGFTGVVEVATKLEHAEQVDRAKKIAAGETPDGVARSTFTTPTRKIESTTAVMHPFGAPDPDKEGDTTQTNAISRICAVKGKETQIVEGQPGILWIDFRDLGDWPGVLTVDDTSPLISGHGGSLTSGPFWYGFYGWKGAPVLEGHAPDRKSVTPMGHYGRFHPDSPKKSLYFAAVICLEKATVLFENPAASERLPDAVRIALTRLPWFDISHSIADWKNGDVQRSTELARSMIETLSASPADE